MKNTPTKLLSALLALVMVMSAFVTCFSFTATAAETKATVNKAQNLIQGMDFDGYDSSKGTAAEYLRDTIGMWMTTQKADSAHGGMEIVDVDGKGNKALRLTSNAYFINTNVSDSLNKTKYEKVKEFVDLFCDSNGPQKFTFSLDMTFNAKTNGDNNVAITSDAVQHLALITAEFRLLLSTITPGPLRLRRLTFLLGL